MTTLTDTKRGTGFTCVCDILPPTLCPQHMDVPIDQRVGAPQKYVAGFFFNKSGEVVLLVRKNRPQWQAGKLNAIGGHIEAGECAIDAMCREFREETGWTTEAYDWRQFATITGHGFLVYFYMTKNEIPMFRSVTDEEIGIYGVDKLLSGVYPMLPNLRWLIPLALDKDKVSAEIIDPGIGGEG